MGRLLETVDLIVIRHGTAPEVWGARVNWGWPRTSKEDGIGRRRRGSVPLGEPRNVWVAGIQESLVACLRLLN